jgi:hypothetical protein
MLQPWGLAATTNSTQIGLFHFSYSIVCNISTPPFSTPWPNRQEKIRNYFRSSKNLTTIAQDRRSHATGPSWPACLCGTKDSHLLCQTVRRKSSSHPAPESPGVPKTPAPSGILTVISARPMLRYPPGLFVAVWPVEWAPGRCGDKARMTVAITSALLRDRPCPAQPAG